MTVTDKPETKLPLGIRVIENPDQLTITRRWWSVGHISLLVFGLIVLVFGARFTPKAPASPNDPVGQFVDQIFIPGVMIVLASGALVYAIFGAISVRRIVLTRDQLIVRDRPMPMLWKRSILAGAVRSVRRRNESQRGYHSRTYYYIVDANLKDGTTVEIDRCTDNEAQAEAMCELMNRWLRQKQ